MKNNAEEICFIADYGPMFIDQISPVFLSIR